MYYMFGFLFLVFVILLVTCSEATILLCYFHLCAEVSICRFMEFVYFQDIKPRIIFSECKRSIGCKTQDTQFKHQPSIIPVSKHVICNASYNRAYIVDWSLNGIMTSKLLICEYELPWPAASLLLISQRTSSSVIIPYRIWMISKSS